MLVSFRKSSGSRSDSANSAKNTRAASRISKYSKFSKFSKQNSRYYYAYFCLLSELRSRHVRIILVISIFVFNQLILNNEINLGGKSRNLYVFFSCCWGATYSRIDDLSICNRNIILIFFCLLVIPYSWYLTFLYQLGKV